MRTNIDFAVTRVAVELVYPLRQSILRPDKPYEFSMYPADTWPATLHLGAFYENGLVGIASVYEEAPAGEHHSSAWRLRDMGVVENFRRQGCASALLRECLLYSRSCGGTLFWCYARETAVAFYSAKGFQLRKQSFELPGFGPRFFMWRGLKDST